MITKILLLINLSKAPVCSILFDFVNGGEIWIESS
jgi:hypothetical protein